MLVGEQQSWMAALAAHSSQAGEKWCVRCHSHLVRAQECCMPLPVAAELCALVPLSLASGKKGTGSRRGSLLNISINFDIFCGSLTHQSQEQALVPDSRI